jgi:hypothetical protein
MVADKQFQKPLLSVEQSKVLCGKLMRPQLVEMDGNAYVRPGDAGANPLISWSPAEGENCTTEFTTLDVFERLHRGFETHGQHLEMVLGSVFLSPELANYELQKGAMNPISRPLPVELRPLPDWGELKSRVPGAFPVVP